jgi:hypothetical protein
MFCTEEGVLNTVKSVRTAAFFIQSVANIQNVDHVDFVPGFVLNLIPS